MKKLIFVLLALGIVGAIVGGCSGGEETTEPATTAGDAGAADAGE
jgi:hypothetical protein